MKKLAKAAALGLSSLLALGLLAGCGGGGDDPLNETPDKDAPAYSDQNATLTLSGNILTTRENTVSEDLFGLFLEDINYASQALDDNLVANGSFESTKAISQNDHDYAWTGGNGLSFAVKTDDNKLHVNSPYYASVATPAGGTLTNSGFRAVPMFVQNGTDYLFSAFLRGYTGEITVRAKAGSDVYAEKTFSVAAADDAWMKVEQTVHATDTGRDGVALEIVFAEADPEVLVDAVQFETLDATVGFKNYAYNAIKDLSPAFFRFPGGCVIEGTGMDNAYDWKNSVGAVKEGENDVLPAFTYTLNKDGAVSEQTTYGEWATRVPNGNLWQQNSTYYPHEYGIGFYEYFLLCESLNAKAIPIVNCGLSCMVKGAVALSGRHNRRVDDYIQDAIDLIEFAKGGTDTEWGHIRELMGHPAPFDMDYIGIGNEQWGDYYKSYYEKFLKNEAFRKALSDYHVQPIVGNCTMFEHCENPDINRQGAAQTAATAAVNNGVVGSVAEYGVVDQHYYVNYTDFLANTALYDNYTRPEDDESAYYDVFVGEYAVNSAAIRSPRADDNTLYNHTDNSMITALAEAAMMTGFERNGDIVKLAAYAPMFGTLAKNNRQWQVDMMYFDSEDILLTPNYYVQQLFMKNTGDYKVEADLAFENGATLPRTTYTANKGSGSESERTLDDIFYVADADRETGDVIVKIVNAGETTVKLNIKFGVKGKTVRGIADVTELCAESKDSVNTLDDTAVRPERYTVGIKDLFGFAVQPYSVTSIRIRVK